MALVASVAGRAIISQILQPMANRAGTETLDQCDFMCNVKREIRNLERTLNVIQGVLQEADVQKIKNVHIRAWLWQLVDIGYEGRDVLDEYFTHVAVEAMKSSGSVVRSYSFPFCFSFNCCCCVASSTYPVSLPLKLRFRLARDVRNVRLRVKDMMWQNEIFSILQSVRVDDAARVPSERPEVGSFVNGQRDLLVGREDVRKEILKKLLECKDTDVHLVPIWGMGGVGKTTLAQSIYNDKTVNGKYPSENRSWLSVGKEKFNAKEIIAKIIQEPSTSSADINEVIQKKLVEKLEGNKFLIVLDDVWEVDSIQWDIFWNPLTRVGKGGVVIMTTRTSETISATNSLVSNHIEPLSYEDCWSIFKSCAFINGIPDNNGPNQKVEIGRDIVKKLKGLPLAAKVVGHSLLKETDEKTWRNFLKDEEWKQGDTEDSVMPALRWSYHRLPLNLKQCFSYCALFPKEHVFDKKVLVEMWMAHGYLFKNEAGGEVVAPEHLGDKYFRELLHASLLQCVDNQYVMHDMIHDLLLVDSTGEFTTQKGSLSIDQMEKTRHMTIISDDDYSKNLSSWKTKRMLTIYTHKWSNGGPQITIDRDILVGVFQQLKSIRVLVLSHGQITRIPDSISKLIHLRYLDVRKTGVRILPDSLCHLYNLQSLAVSIDAILPVNIVNMTSLRYLRANLRTCKGIRNLKSLQELSCISVCKDDNIGELGDLNQLRGKLTIKGLENVTILDHAAEALMDKKSLIDELELEFEFESTTAAISLLDKLQFPPYLIHLKIIGYTGVTPPPLGELRYLKHLYLCMLPGFEKLGDKFYGKWLFPSLESLELRDMKNWKEFGAVPIVNDSGVQEPFFPRLTELIIYDCPELTDINIVSRYATKLEHLDISCCDKLTEMELGSLPSLSRVGVGCCYELVSISGLVAVKNLNIYECNKLKSVRTNFQGLDSVEHFKVFRCPLLRTICEQTSATAASAASSSSSFRSFFSKQPVLPSSSPWSRLQRLSIDNVLIFRNIFQQQDLNSSITCMYITESVEILESLGQEWMTNQLRLLEKLYIYDCYQLDLLPNGCLPRSLQLLEIHNCPNLQSLPEDGLPLSLTELKIQQSPLLRERCKDESGADWDKIRHILRTNIR